MVFSPDIGVEASSHVLDIPEYACGLILGFALISNENPHLETASDNLKIMVFSPQLGVERAFGVLDIPMYACGSKLTFALIWNQNPHL
jgi:hypothetical protein